MAKRRVEPLPAEVFAELAAALPHGAALTNVAPAAEPLELATAVDQAIVFFRTKPGSLSDEQITGLGVLWGKAVSQATGWTWAQLIEGESKLTCLVAQDHAHVCVPLAFVREQLEASTPCTALVLFNIIREGNLPPAEMEDLVFAG
jgi:hypothetical protein